MSAQAQREAADVEEDSTCVSASSSPPRRPCGGCFLGYFPFFFHATFLVPFFFAAGWIGPAQLHENSPAEKESLFTPQKDLDVIAKHGITQTDIKKFKVCSCPMPCHGYAEGC
jgi:hypothetical protein